MDKEVLQGVLFIMGLLLAVIGWFARDGHAALKRSLELEKDARANDRAEASLAMAAEREARRIELVEERRLREKLATDVENDINAVGSKLNAFQLAVAKEYVSFERMRDAMGGLGEKLDDMRRHQDLQIAELKAGQEEIFRRLDQKQDKRRTD